MKSPRRGKSTSKAEILNISKFGIWMLVLGKEYFLSFDEFPWFQGASIEQIYTFELVHDRHLYWEALDIDLAISSLEEPHKFPLKAKSHHG
ncbi:MAG: DUF2442 domain-containing protein [Bdellovibrionaceae bacterium]|nr:DUF2442 domain-containing protein [Pseudobdellovibrionaceae bacterium]